MLAASTTTFASFRTPYWFLRQLVGALDSEIVQQKIAELVCLPLLQTSNAQFGKAIGSEVGGCL